MEEEDVVGDVGRVELTDIASCGAFEAYKCAHGGTAGIYLACNSDLLHRDVVFEGYRPVLDAAAPLSALRVVWV